MQRTTVPTVESLAVPPSTCDRPSGTVYKSLTKQMTARSMKQRNMFKWMVFLGHRSFLQLYWISLIVILAFFCMSESSDLNCLTSIATEIYFFPLMIKASLDIPYEIKKNKRYPDYMNAIILYNEMDLFIFKLHATELLQ